MAIDLLIVRIHKPTPLIVQQSGKMYQVLCIEVHVDELAGLSHEAQRDTIALTPVLRAEPCSAKAWSSIRVVAGDHSWYGSPRSRSGLKHVTHEAVRHLHIR